MDDADNAKAPRSTHDERLTRLLDAGDATDRNPDPILYMHTVMCQTGLPYRNPGDDVREWERVNGAVHMSVTAGKVMHPELGRFVHLGLPYGPKPRLLLAHLARTNGSASCYA